MAIYMLWQHGPVYVNAVVAAWPYTYIYIYIYIPVNPLPGVETNDDWVVWLTVVLIKLISETQFCCVSHSWLAFI